MALADLKGHSWTVALSAVEETSLSWGQSGLQQNLFGRYQSSHSGLRAGFEKRVEV